MRTPDIGGVYQIRNLSNGKVYIGSAAGIQHRWRQHLTNLRRGVHTNQKLQRAWNKYGEADFVFEVLQEVETDDKLLIQAAEQAWLDRVQCCNDRFGYNINPTADGLVRSPETCAKLSLRKRGEGHHQNKLTDADVLSIKARLAAGGTQQAIAADFGVTAATIGGIRQGDRWTHVPWPAGLPAERKQGAGRWNVKLTETDVTAIKQALAAGITTKNLAEQYDVTQATISDIKWERSWKQVPWQGPYTPRRDSKLTPDQISEVKARLAAGEAGCTIAKFFDVSEQFISAVKHGRVYK